MSLNEALYILLIAVEIIFLMSVTIYILALIYSWLKGAPYVPTQQKELDGILEQATITKDDTFFELGCGDGRMVRRAAEKYDIKGIGIDINPGLIMHARMVAKRRGIKNVDFCIQDITKTDLSEADIIYIFLFPKLIEKIEDKLMNETKSEVFIISHGFKIPFLASMKIGERPGKKFTTYYYQKVHPIPQPTA